MQHIKQVQFVLVYYIESNFPITLNRHLIYFDRIGLLVQNKYCTMTLSKAVKCIFLKKIPVKKNSSLE